MNTEPLPILEIRITFRARPHEISGSLEVNEHLVLPANTGSVDAARAALAVVDGLRQRLASQAANPEGVR